MSIKLTPDVRLSPDDRLAVLDMVAEKLAAGIRHGIDLDELIAMPIDAVVQMTGMSAAQIRRDMPTRMMGKRKLGVSLKTIKTYLKII